MSLFFLPNRRAAALQKEWKLLLRREAALRQAAVRPAPGWKDALERKIPPKAAAGLRSAFAKAFGLVLDKGVAVIEKSYDKQTLQQDYALRDYAVQLKGGRKQLRAVRKGAAGAEPFNLALTTLEGVGLGVLGVGLPDLVLFLGMLFKGVYQTALQYGYDYTSPDEKLFVLAAMEGALAREEAFAHADAAVDALLTEPALPQPTAQQLQAQLRSTADVFAVELLALKFIQGLPVAGVLGGAANPVYYHRVLQYVRLKYHKRWLLQTARQQGVQLAPEKATR